MNIGYDAKKACCNLTGIGNYSRRVVNAIHQYYPNIHLELYAPKKGNPNAKAQLPPLDILTRGIGYELWRCFGINKTLKKRHIDVYHGLSNEIPWGISHSGAKSIVTLHDLIFRIHPETYSYSARLILNFKTRYACKKADHIVAISECTKNDLVKQYKVLPEKISVVYQSIDDKFRQPLDKTSTIDFRYILCVGTIERRKNQLTLVQSLAHIDKDIHLVLVGKSTPYQRLIENEAQNLGVSHRVHIMNNINNEKLTTLYAHAEVFLYMSIYEGFGIPVAEALAMGIPVVASNSSCLQEAGGPDSIYLNPNDYKGIAQAVTHIISDEELRTKMIANGKEFCKKFNDQSMAHSLNELYLRVSKPKTLIIRLSALGDVAMTLPLVIDYATKHPEKEIYYLTQTFFGQLLKDAPSNLHTITLNHKEYQGWKGIRKLTNIAKQLQPDEVVDMHNVSHSWKIDLAMALRGKRVLMLKKNRRERKLILQHKKVATPFTQRYKDLLESLDHTQLSFVPQQASNPTNKIGIAPFARYSNKAYPLNKIETLVQLLLEQTNDEIHLFGSRGAEQELLEKIAQKDERIISHAGKHKLNEELSWMSQMRVMVTMDSANMHLASMVGTHVVSIWGSTTPACGFLGWNQDIQDAIIANIPCQPCTIAGSNHCKMGDFRCLNSIDPQTIVNTIKR